MFNYMYIYIIEAIILGLIWIIGATIYIIKHKKGILKFMGISLFIFIIAFIITFILEKPQMDIKEIENIEVKSNIEIKPPKTYYHFKDETNYVKVVHNIDIDKIGKYNVQFELNTMIGKYTKNAIVNVIDTTPPEIELQQEEEYKQSYSKEYNEPGFTANDLYDGDVSQKVEISKVEINENEYNIEYKVQDSSGNIAKKVRHVTIVDDIPPTINLNGSQRMYLKLGEKYTENGAKASDEKDGDLTNKIEKIGDVDTSKEGEYKISYKVSDTKGNEATITRIVVVSEEKETSLPGGVSLSDQNGSNGTKGTIYLTFDDGPSANITPKILDILSQKGVKATFFILNYGSDGENLVKREYNEGHTIGIHGYSHDYAQIYQSVDTYMTNITKLQNKIKQSTGYNATITRFPGGSSNTISRRYCQGIMTVLCKEMVSRGYRYFDWNVDSDDAGSAKTSEKVYSNVTSRLSKSRSNVVLMHDFSGNTKTLNALADIIDYGLANGYRFERITESTPMVTHTPNN